MRNSYIANSHEAAAINAGKQTAVVVKMAKQPNGEPASLLDWAKGLAKACNASPSKQEIDDKALRLTGRIFPFKSKNGHLFSPIAPYKLGQEVYVREKWAEYKNVYVCNNLYVCMRGGNSECICNKKYIYNGKKASVYERSALQSPATMPQSAARTRFKVVGVEVVRVRDMAYRDAIKLPIRHVAEYAQYAINKFGQQAWDNNEFIWYFKIEKI